MTKSTNSASSTGKQQAKRGSANIVELGRKTRFKKNNPETGEKDPKINRKGAPRQFDDLRQAVLDIFGEDVVSNAGLKFDQAEFMLRQWILSGDFQKQNRALEIGFGKVPDEVRHRSDEGAFVQRHLDKFTDGELQRIQAGENGMDILLSKLETQLARRKA